ncbi:hypothetical protein BGZ63DRAFT_244628 [Mariannaea sp. PMI_226]|nr:hypothetical protein BGZ63DRAFT_244628 [Mariannaea sp. PMI_226]
MTPIPTHSLPHRCSAQDGGRPPDIAGSSSQGSSGKLGDFTTKLHSLTSVALTPSKKTSQVTQTYDSSESLLTPVSSCHQQLAKPLTLGDFSKIFNQFASSTPSAHTTATTSTLSVKAKPIKILQRPPLPQSTAAIATSKQLLEQSPAKHTSLKVTPCASDSQIDFTLKSDSGSGLESDQEPSTYSTPASSPSTSVEEEPSPLAKLVETKGTDRTLKSEKSAAYVTRRSPVSQTALQNRGQLVLTYQFYNHGPTIPVYDHVPTQEMKHKSLTQKLITERVVDKILSVENPNLINNGVHVFVDMSNITISFQKVLRARYSLPETVRFVPLPSMNMSFLQEVLVRGRNVKALNAGCSMRPNRAEPDYVQELRRLGYRVDLRYRQPEGSQSPEEIRGTSGHPRYVEDMVDETLQTRIGESVMQYFCEPGTLVLATGDARPAKFSDGFFTYADRALKMGWNVEVVSWKSSLSGTWTKPAWTQQWGHRFRVIELDGFVDDLFETYVC